MSQVFATPGPPIEVYDTILDSETHDDIIFWVLYCWLHFGKLFALPNIMNPRQRWEGTSSFSYRPPPLAHAQHRFILALMFFNGSVCFCADALPSTNSSLFT